MRVWPGDTSKVLGPREGSYEPDRWSGADADALVEALAVERAGGVRVSGVDGNLMLSSVTRREHVVGMFGGIEGFGPVVDGCTSFRVAGFVARSGC